MSGAAAIGLTRGPAEIEAEIRQTRERVGVELEAISRQLRPERIKQRAKAAVSVRLLRAARNKPVLAALVAVTIAIVINARRRVLRRVPAR